MGDRRFVKDVTPFSRDRLSLVSRDLSAEGAMRMLDVIQTHRPEVQVAGAALLFAAWCHRLGLDPHDLWQQGMKMMKPQPGHHKGNINVEVLRDFAGIRLAGDERVDIR
jgi:hypothetical protein